MIDKMTRSLVLVTAMLVLLRIDVLGAESLPPRALARIGDHRFYHGPGIACAVLSPDGRRAASAVHYPVTDDERDAYTRAIVLWDAVTGERLRELLVPSAPIECLAFSADGKRLAAAYTISGLAPFASRAVVVVFDVETGKVLRQLKEFNQAVHHLQFSADGKQLRVSECDGPVSAWDTASGKQLRLWKPPAKKDEDSGKVARGVLSPDGKVVAWEVGCQEDVRMSIRLRVHDAATDKLLYQMRLKRHEKSFTFSADGKRFAANCLDKLTSSDSELTIWETATGKKRRTLADLGVQRFALTPDGQQAAIYTSDGRLRMWDLQTGKPARDLCPPFLPLKNTFLAPPFVFSADGKTLLLATDSTLRLLDTTTGKERVVSGHRAAVTPHFSADGRTLFTSCGERRCRWNVSGKEPALSRHERKNAWEINSLAYSGDDRLFLDEVDQRFRIRATASGRVQRELESDDWRPVSGRFAPDASRVLLDYVRGDRLPDERPDLLRLYDLKLGKVSGQIKPVDQMGTAMFSPDGRLIAWAAHSGGVHLHDAVSGKAVRTLHSVRSFATVDRIGACLLFSPDSEYAIEGRLMLPMRVFQVSSGREIARFYGNPEQKSKAGALSCLACSPDNRLIAVAEEESGTVRLIEVASGKMRVEFAGHRHGVHGLAFAPDGKTLASGGEDNVVFLWDVTGARTTIAANKARDNDLTSWWSDLASEDGKCAGVAIASLLRKPEASVAFFQERLRPAQALDDKRLARLLADLDDAAFETREAANRELTRLGERAEAALRRALANRPSLEMRRRIEDVLSKLEPTPPSSETLRMLRAIEVLEYVGTPAARRCLETLAKGAPDARQTRDAKAALQRLANKRA
jgi:WD40 repeat protein